jgi:hypothetical protein
MRLHENNPRIHLAKEEILHYTSFVGSVQNDRSFKGNRGKEAARLEMIFLPDLMMCQTRRLFPNGSHHPVILSGAKNLLLLNRVLRNVYKA